LTQRHESYEAKSTSFRCLSLAVLALLTGAKIERGCRNPEFRGNQNLMDCLLHHGETISHTSSQKQTISHTSSKKQSKTTKTFKRIKETKIEPILQVKLCRGSNSKQAHEIMNIMTKSKACELSVEVMSTKSKSSTT